MRAIKTSIAIKATADPTTSRALVLFRELIVRTTMKKYAYFWLGSASFHIPGRGVETAKDPDASQTKPLPWEYGVLRF